MPANQKIEFPVISEISCFSLPYAKQESIEMEQKIQEFVVNLLGKRLSENI
jgi:hypothetical protein